MIIRQDKEQWRCIEGFPGYLISNRGRVYTEKRRGSPNDYLVGQALKYGHRKVHLCKNGRIYPKKVHRLVLEAFIGPCPAGMETCHNDGNPANNNLDNLRWDTHKNNKKDQIKHGRVVRGEGHPGSKLTEQAVREIRQKYIRRIYSSYKLAKEYGVCPSLIGLIVRRRLWRHIK